MTLPADPFPLARYLVSAAAPPVPPGFTEVRVAVPTGLPFAVALS